MFTGLPETERAAFFSLLDEYFQARPHLLPSGIQASYDPTVAHAQAPAPAGVTVNRQDLERAGQFAATPTGQKITGFAAGKVLGNKALGSYAASSWANHHNSNVTPAPGASSAAAPPPPARKGPPPPPSASSKPQVSGLQSGRSLGSINFGSKSQAIGSVLGRKPSAGSATGTSIQSSAPAPAPTPALRSPPPPAGAASSYGSLPPPVRRGTGVVSPPAPVESSPAPAYTETVEAEEGIGSAEAMYDYGDGSDPDDLIVVEGERIILLEKISDDWWRGKKTDGSGATGIVPTAYVRQL